MKVIIEIEAAQATIRLQDGPSGTGTGEGTGPSGDTHTRFRTWKQDLQSHP